MTGPPTTTGPSRRRRVLTVLITLLGLVAVGVVMVDGGTDPPEAVALLILFGAGSWGSLRSQWRREP